MIKGKKHICIIGARKGSTRLPHKNRKILGGQPLYMRPILAAEKSNIFKAIIFTTDDEAILNGLSEHGKRIVDRRPVELADDQSSMWDVGRYLIEKYPELFHTADTLCFLTPCHPFVASRHIHEAYQLYTQKKAQNLVSVTPFDCPPELALDMADQWISRQWEGLVRKGDHPTRYYPNGAITIWNHQHFKTGGLVYSNRTVGYILKWPYNLDIDYEEDFDMAVQLHNSPLTSIDA